MYLPATAGLYLETMFANGFGEEGMLARFGFSSMDDYFDYVVEEAFSSKSYNYSFDADKTALFLEGGLPSNKGVNELAGKTLQGYVFTDSGYTYTDNETTITGSYTYNSSTKWVYLLPKTINGKTRSEYYESITVDSSHRFPDDYAARANETNITFYAELHGYNSEDNILEG